LKHVYIIGKDWGRPERTGYMNVMKDGVGYALDDLDERTKRADPE